MKVKVEINEIETRRCDVLCCDYKSGMKDVMISFDSGEVYHIWVCGFHYTQIKNEAFWAQTMVRNNMLLKKLLDI